MKFSPIVRHYSSKFLVYASILVLLCSLAPHVLAAGEYSVEKVAVDTNGKDASEARTKALAMGEKDAFAQLILRLSPSHASEILAKITPKQVSAALLGYTVVEEKMTSDHYHAILTYNFNPSQIQPLIPISPPPTPPPASDAASTAPAAPTPSHSERKAVLVLPVYNKGDSLQLWQDENKWRDVWYEAALESGEGLIVVPLGEMNDRVDVDDTNVSTATPDSLKRMYDRYGVGDIIIAQAFFNQKADPKPTLEVSLKRLDGGKPVVTQISYTIHSTENLDALLVRASNDIAQTLFKQQTIDPNKIEVDRIKEIHARINTTNIAEWQALRSRLLMRSNIVDIKFVSISYYETDIIIVFKGTPDMLGKTLVASGLRVLQDGDRLVLSVK